MRWLILLPPLAGCAYWLFAWWVVRAFFRRSAATPGNFLPSVSVLKPLRGLDSQIWENLRSFCQQDYPSFQIILGVQDADDLACELARRFAEQHTRPAVLLVVGATPAANPKAGILHNLAGHALGQVVVVSDGDIRVGRDYLRRTVADLENPRVGLVTCLYRGSLPLSLPARLEALHMGAVFLPSVLIASRFTPVQPGLGATLALRREDLERIGGFAAISDYLADDYELARRIHAMGLEVRLSSCLVDSVLGASRLRQQWHRELRWARGIRCSCFWGYLGLLLTFPIVLALAACPLAGHWVLGAALVAGSVLVRYLTAWRILVLIGQADPLRLLPWTAIREAMSFAVWLAGLFGRTVTWRDRRFRLLRDGRIRPIPRFVIDRSATGLKAMIARLDHWLRLRQRIYEFTDDPECIWRLSIHRARRELRLADGTCIRTGDVVGAIHMWNEHLPQVASTGPSLGWARTLDRRFRHSFRLLAEHIRTDPRACSVAGICARSTVAVRSSAQRLDRILERYGFELVESPDRPTLLQRCHDLGEDLLVWALTWAFNPGSLRGAELRRQRRYYWISRSELLRRYSPAASGCSQSVR